MITLGLDAGGSATRCVVLGADTLVRGDAPPMNGHLFDEAAIARARAAIEGVAGLVPAGVEAVVAGVTGLSADAPEAAVLVRMVAARLGVPEERVWVQDDLAIAHRAAFPRGMGILLYSGTGSAAFHVAADGATARAGGHGFVLDDGGSGFAIGRDGLQAVLRREDEAPGRGWATPLGAAVSARIGGRDWNDVRAHVYGGEGGPRDRVARFAIAVGEAARAGDAAALGVLRDAGEELARLARVLAGRIGAQPVALAGRAATVHPLIRETIERELGMAVTTGHREAAEAAALLARELAS